MAQLKDKAVGKTKQVVAEIVGDDKLRKEGDEQEEEARQKPNEVDPLGNPNKLT